MRWGRTILRRLIYEVLLSIQIFMFPKLRSSGRNKSSYYGISDTLKLFALSFINTSTSMCYIVNKRSRIDARIKMRSLSAKIAK